MEKYTKHDVLVQRISFKPMDSWQHSKLCVHFNKQAGMYYNDSHYRFYTDAKDINDKYGTSSISYLKLNSNIKSTKEISFEQFDFEDGFVLPENKQNPHQKEKQMRKITAEQAQSIINISCNQWQEKLANHWSTRIVLNKEILIQEEFYKEMREACTDIQHKLFDEIFGADKPNFTSRDLAVGEMMILTDNPLFHSSLKSTRIIKTLDGELYNIDKNIIYSVSNVFNGEKITSKLKVV